MINTNYFTMGDLLRVCDEFAAWLVDVYGQEIFPNFLELSYNEPNFERLYEIVKERCPETETQTKIFQLMLFLEFCKAVPEAADEIPVDNEIMNKICIWVFDTWEHGDLTKQAIDRLGKKYETESRPGWLH